MRFVLSGALAVFLTVFTLVCAAEVGPDTPLMNFERMGSVQDFSLRAREIVIDGKGFKLSENLKIHNFANNDKKPPLGIGSQVGYVISQQPGKSSQIDTLWVLSIGQPVEEPGDQR